MSDLIVVDTDILIDAGRNINEAVNYLQQIEQQTSLAISVITQMELFVGCRNKAELRTTERFLKRFQIIKLNEQISDTAIDLLRRYRLSHGLLIADGFPSLLDDIYCGKEYNVVSTVDVGFFSPN